MSDYKIISITNVGHVNLKFRQQNTPNTIEIQKFKQYSANEKGGKLMFLRGANHTPVEQELRLSQSISLSP